MNKNENKKEICPAEITGKRISSTFFLDERVKDILKKATIYVVPFLLFFISLFWGRYMMDPSDVMTVLAGKTADTFFPFLNLQNTYNSINETVIMQIRLPRVIAAMLIGAGLSIAGASYQGLFRNPLVSPDILGVASGAGFGAALAILLYAGSFMTQVSAFVFAIAAVSLTCLIAKAYKGSGTLVLVLSGIIISALFSALLSALKYVADPYDTLPAIVFWLMGSLSSVSMSDVLSVAPPILIAGFVLYLIRWRINILSVSEEEARALGVDTKNLGRVIILCATVITASCVCISGIIGWVGLVIPHIARMLVGPDFKKLIPASILLGASYLLIVDDISRTLIETEIPIGILTALIGAPFFAYLLTRKKVGWL
ncbi:iron complex transport system permease protein [Methanomicrobium sp. W14]|uniref:FecCD family ABC transporter permease n=1 Tax=Methanomicrobium sp. W14 TaxID=2817839 RepID=UPI001AE10521|nr:iron ABC transporter permease [Methanomicrobium sp. W14]MBP2134417.1 iron complex transport system permease protein [Methanomicrobium sp. W14]